MVEEPAGSPGRGGGVFLLATVFCSGAAVMIVEMTAVRVLQPFFGSTTWVWTNVIAVVLASLSVGYALGGRLADRHPRPVLLYGLLGTGGLLVATAALLGTAVSGLFLDPGFDLADVLRDLVRGSLGASLVLFAPATFVLGMVSPLAIRLLAAGGVGRAAGRVFAVSTAGSILGTYLPVILLVPRFGSRGALLFAAALLLLPAVAGLLLNAGARRRVGAAALLLLLAGGAVAAGTDRRPNRPVPVLSWGGRSRVLGEVESSYQYLSVREDRYPDGTVEEILTMNECLHAYHSYRVRGRVLTGLPHHDEYSVLPMLLDVPPGAELRILMLGVACGVDVNQWRHFWGGLYRLRVFGVEIDPSILALGRRYFDLPGPGSDWLTVFTMDGRQFLRSRPAGETYDAIVVDAFSNELSVPFHMATREFFAECRSRLEPGGLLAMNVNALDGASRNLHAVENTLAAEFGACRRVGRPDAGTFRLIAGAGEDGPDFARLTGARVRRRFGDRPDVPEWDDLVSLAAAMPASSCRIGPREGEWILTDDHAPLEWLSDRFGGPAEPEGVDPGPRPGGLAARQTRLLLFAGTAWLVLWAGLWLKLRDRGRSGGKA